MKPKHRLMHSSAHPRMHRLMHPLITVALLLAFFPGCSASSEIVLMPDLSGKASIRIDAADFLVEYYRDLSGNYESPGIFSPGFVRAGFSTRPGVRIDSLSVPGEGSLELELSFSNINKILAEENIAGDFIISEALDGARRRIRLKLDREIVQALLSLGPVADNVVADYLLPSRNSSADTEKFAEESAEQYQQTEQYRGDLIWALEDYGSQRSIASAIDSSVLRIVLLLPHPGTEISNGVLRTSPRPAAVFEIKTLELLTMTSAREYSLIYQEK